ncbi:MAG TPA: DUF503 domain-containing protein [Polyangiaceae bacterium]
MFVGTARFVIHIPAAQTLKDRRRVVNQLKERLRARLAVSICEVGNAEQYQVARIGLATVSRDAEGCRRVIASARSVAESLKDAILADAKGEVLAFGADGEHLGGGIESGVETWIAGEPVSTHAVAHDPARTGRLTKRLRKEQ